MKFFWILLILAACDNDGLIDQSKAAIQYRVISLPNSLRRPIIKLQFDTINSAVNQMNQIPKIPVTQTAVAWDYFDAILGRNLDKQALIASGYYTGSISDAELGLVKTTTDLVIPSAQAMDANSIQVTFEDDVVLPVDLDLSFRFALKAAPGDWDMLFLGCNEGSIKNGPFYPNNSGHPTCPSKGLVPLQGSTWRKVTDICLTGAYAYALRKSSADKLANLINQAKPISKPIDILYQSFFGGGKINAYCLGPELIRPNYAFESEIGDR